MSLLTNSNTRIEEPESADIPASDDLSVQMPALVRYWKAHSSVFEHVSILLDIFEGNLLEYLERDLQDQLSEQSYKACKHRLAPINLLRKIVEKVSKIYQPAPARRIIGGNESDTNLFEWYCENFRINTLMREGAETLSLTKSVLAQPFIHDGKPRGRIVQNDHMFVASFDTVDPLCPTHVVTFAKTIGSAGDAAHTEFTAYTADQMLIFNEKEETNNAAMTALENPLGVNPFGAIPFVYAVQSKRRIMPQPDSDVLRMTKLLPILFSDLNYSVMFQSFAIMYGINVDEQNLKMAPNAFWRFKQDSTTDAPPSIGVLKPSVDINGVLGLIETQLSLWLNSRGIRPGSIGKLTKDNFASGISKMIDEMDTVELRQILVDEMREFEERWWDLVMFKMHPVWLAQGLLGDVAGRFTPGCKVELSFNTQTPIISRGQLVTELAAERAAGFTTLDRCLNTLNPLLTEDDITQMVTEIAEDQAKLHPPGTAEIGKVASSLNAAGQQAAGAALEATT